MAVRTKSGKKAHRASIKRGVFNARRKKAMKDAVKTTGKFISEKKAADAGKSLPELYKAIDKAAKLGTIKKNTAARMKSRLTKRVSALSK